VDVVIDASAAVAWYLQDEFDDDAAALLDHVVEHGAIVPALWAVEMQNALRNAHRRGCVDAGAAAEILKRLSQLPLRVIDADSRPVFRNALSLAIEHDISVYDAVYLDVAIRFNARLASRDNRLLLLANKIGIETAP
jgi:predicted nucleic acid-binding protein